MGAVVASVGIKEEYVAGAHQCDFRQVGGVYLPLSQADREIFVAVRMIFGNFQAEGRKLHHSRLTDLHKLAELIRENERRRMAKIYETEKSFGTHFAIEHRSDLPRTVFGIASERVARGDRLRQP